MQRFIFFLSVFFSITVWSQQQSAQNKVDWNLLTSLSKRFATQHKLDDLEKERFPLYRIGSEWYVSLYGKTVSNVNWVPFKEAGVLVGATAGEIATIKVPLSLLHSLDFS